MVEFLGLRRSRVWEEGRIVASGNRRVVPERRPEGSSGKEQREWKMTTGRNDSNKQLYVRSTPAGEAGPEHFEVREAPVPVPADGEVLIESHFLSMDAALRLLLRNSTDFLFRLAPGDLVRNTVAGRVVASRHPDFAPGDSVIAPVGVQSMGLAAGADVEKCDTTQAPLATWLGGFGISGLTAYFATFAECRPQPCDTVVINGAAGAVGSMAGQFAKLAGARVIGIAGSDDKCHWLENVLGFDRAINYREGNLYDQLKAAAPDRIDFVFDNVGGPILDESLRWLAMHAKVLLCGSTSQYGAEAIAGPSQYIWFGTMRAALQGFVVYDYRDRFAEARRHMARWLAEGRLQLPQHVVDGDIEDFPAAFRQFYRGAGRGKMLLRLPAAER
jgi:NADPH-dependent curcumin reductase CurA